MKIIDIFEETFSALAANKVRTALTMLGIVIGIGSVIAMVSIGQGAQASIESSIQSIGSNLLIVMPGAQRSVGSQVSTARGSATSLKLEDATAIGNEISGIKGVAPEASKRFQVVYSGKNTNTQIDGITPAYSDVRTVEVDSGSFITDQQVSAGSKVAVLGPTVREDLFGAEEDPIGQSVKINKIEFKVIGVTKAKGGSGFGSQDDMIFVPISTAQKFLLGGDSVNTINIAAETAEVMTDVQQQVTDLLLERHKISDPTLADFNILNQADIVSAASSVTGTLSALLGAIAGISLLVGGIGIMNMMLTTVTERTREIGLRKAIGAKNGDISIQFLTESVMLTFSGGVLGVAFGWGASFLMSQFAGLTTKISTSSVLLAFGVSALIGIVFGYYPAKRASRLNPIEALRYE